MKTYFLKYLTENYVSYGKHSFLYKHNLNNEHRHFGRKIFKNIHLFFIEDIFYMFTQDEECLFQLLFELNLLEYKIHFKIIYRFRNNIFNILRDDKFYYLYIRDKDFNRNRHQPIGIFEMVHKNNTFFPEKCKEQTIFAIYSEEDFSCIEVLPFDSFNFKYNNKYKSRK